MITVTPRSVVQVDVLTNTQHAAYDAFLASEPGTVLYATRAYQDMVMAELQCHQSTLVATCEGEIVGVLPMLYRDGPLGRLYNSLPYYGSHGGIITSQAEVGIRLSQAYEEILRRRETAASTIIENPFQPVPHPAVPRTHRDRRISQCTPLPALDASYSVSVAEDAVLAVVEGSARRNVKAARRAGVTVTRDASALAELHRLHAANMAVLGGQAKSAGFFARVPSYFTEGTGFDCWIARRDGAVIAGLLVFYHGDTVEYFTPATDAAHRSAEPLALILATALTDAALRGMRHWNWGGTWLTQDGVHRFKRKWGARDRAYEYFVQVNAPALLMESAASLRDMYPGFYVAPYAALATQAGAA